MHDTPAAAEATAGLDARGRAPEPPAARGFRDDASSAVADPSSLVVVSNRLPFEVQRREGRLRLQRSPGGLVTALERVLATRGGVWVGWPGAETDPKELLHLERSVPNVRYRSVALSAREAALHYGSFANRTLWPLFHYFVGTTRIDAASWSMYRRVNDRFAAIAAEEASADAIVWVHDYQLMLVPELVRRRRPAQAIAFFLHIPFPAPDVLRILPWARALLRGVLGADLVGFHTAEYAEHFLVCAERLLGCDVDHAHGRVQFEGRIIAVESHPIGIDAARQEAMARAAAPRDPRRPIEILGVDRLDYTKGIAERFRAVERLFERYPEWRERVVFTQIVVPSRVGVTDYRSLKRQVDEIVGRVNGRFSSRGWAPIRYLTRSFLPTELAAVYRQANVALVTPLRDGMNLVAKEYVASQVDGTGVLVLSELAGAALDLPEALIVNPYDVDDVAEVLHRALTMPEDERRARLATLQARVRASDVGSWLERYLESARIAAVSRAATVSPAEQVTRRLRPWLNRRSALALFLDYDGTLTPIAARPEFATLSDETRRVLEHAVQAPDLDIVVVSGRPLDEVRALVGMDMLTYVGDHGCDIEGPGLSYRHEAADLQAPLSLAERDLEALGIPGAWVERKRTSVAYHVRAVAPDQRDEALRRAELVFRRRRLAPLSGKAVLEGRSPHAWNKGHAALFVLRRRYGAEWPARVRALYVGDDATDELAFRSLRGIGRSILVAPPASAGGTAADLVLETPDDVIELVRRLTAGGIRTPGKPA
jgi:trehalose 6-phosphate synthase/phosphatase